ncbi:hypothetical protein [Arthrobacter sp. Leaf141]|uniref:hypothetical protein n=1 Tax=Arthrobacter sp. Leaf141 TaxID=1736273 RepID=UPI000AC9B5DD|nr:hypothetical protein [Arthrobacter sp. Leaf141]
MHARAGAEIAFKDAVGTFWVRRADGSLEELPGHPFDHLEVPRPINDYPLESAT